MQTTWRAEWVEGQLSSDRDDDRVWAAVDEKEAASPNLLRTVVQQLLGYDER